MAVNVFCSFFSTEKITIGDQFAIDGGMGFDELRLMLVIQRQFADLILNHHPHLVAGFSV